MDRVDLWGFANPVIVFGKSPLAALRGNMQVGRLRKEEPVEVSVPQDANYLVTDGTNNYFFAMREK